MKKSIVALFSIISLSFFIASCKKDEVTTQSARNVAQEEANKLLVRTFYQKLFGDKDLSVIDTYVAENYIQHNPQIADGRAAIKAMATQWLAGAPKSTVDFRKVLGDGNLVVLHIKAPTPDGASYQAITEYFRVENNIIVEHWDVIQDAPTTSANSHPMF